MTGKIFELTPLLEYVSSHNATDLHLCAGSRPLVRISSRLQPVPDTQPLTPEDMEAVVTSLVSTEEQIITLQEKRTLDFSFSQSRLGRFRCNIYSQRGTFAAAIRALPFEIPVFDTLGLPESVASFAHRSRGLVLATGVAGSGKTTTLASLLDIINENYNYHIITIEDPVEYLHRHKKSLVTQREIGADADTFASALKSALREDPDVIMVGEMRDPETIAFALTAAETGHLVFSTLHTMGAAKSIDRIIDAFPPAQQAQARLQLATVLEGVVSQQLIPAHDGNRLVVACEVMTATPAIRNLIREGKHYQINSVLQTGQAQGMQLLENSLASLAAKGLITPEEAMLRAQDTQLMAQLLNRR